MKKIELLAPAGDLERLKYAIRYGADAVYIGGKHFSLRSMASNFTIKDIKKGCEFAHENNTKIYVTCNIVMHEEDAKDILPYLKQLEECGVDGIIASSIYILKLVKEQTKMEAHVSTQQSVCNSKGIKFLENINVDRVVLARECSLENIRDICNNTKTEIEVFIEGAMCASVSGRCMLSNIMTNRDANRGGCAQSCRWNYDIYQEENKVSTGDYEFSMASTDLNGIKYVPALIDAGVSSLKVEGRMKSLHYIATIINAYRRCIDEYYENGFIKDFDIYYKNLSKGENRQVSRGFFEGDVATNEVIYNHGQATASHDFQGIIESYDEDNMIATMEVRNLFVGNREIEILSPGKAPFLVPITTIYDDKDNVIEVANHPQSKIKFKSNIKLKQFDLVR